MAAIGTTLTTPPRSENTVEGGVEKNVRAEEGRQPTKRCFLDTVWPVHHERITVVFACTRQTWSHQHFILDKKGAHEAPSLPKGLFAITLL